MTAQFATANDDTPTTTFERPSAEVYDRIQMLHLVEDALRNATWCACGTQMTVEVEDGTLWLECPTFREPSSGRLAWLRDAIRMTLHQKQVITRGIDLAA